MDWRMLDALAHPSTHVECANLRAEHNPRGRSAGALQIYGEPRQPLSDCRSCNRTNDGWVVPIERCLRDNPDMPLAPLLAADNRIEIDDVDVAAIHGQIISLPTGGSFIQSRSSSDMG